MKPREVLRGYLDLAIAKIRKTRMQSCAKDLRTCSFANFSQWLQIINLAKKLSVKLTKNSRENICSVKVGHILLASFPQKSYRQRSFKSRPNNDE